MFVGHFALALGSKREAPTATTLLTDLLLIRVSAHEGRHV